VRAIGRRLAFFAITVWAAVTLNFLLPRLMPGNPAQALLAQYPHITPQAFRALTTLLGGGQHQSVIVQYGEYWKRWRPSLRYLDHHEFWHSGQDHGHERAALDPRSGRRDDDHRLCPRYLHRAFECVAPRNVARQCAAANGRDWIRPPYFWVGLLLVYIFSVTLGWLPYEDAYNIITDVPA